jgi:hypothetical protein
VVVEPGLVPARLRVAQQHQGPHASRVISLLEGLDRSGAVFWGIELGGARFRDVNMTRETISHAPIVNLDIDCLVDHVAIDGVRVN